MLGRIKRYFAYQIPIIIVVIMVFICIGLLVTHYAKIDQENQRVQYQEKILQQASHLRARMEHEINTTLNLTMGVLVYVAAKPDINQQEFSRMAQRIMQHASYVKNIGLAKDNVISHIYPLVGNEKALGLRYMDTPSQREAVMQAMTTRQTIIAGPINLVQGGQGLISRIPIFLDDQAQSYWGMTSVVVDVDAFLEEVGITQAQATMRIALRGKDAKGKKGAVFSGDAQLFGDAKNVEVTIQLPRGNWLMAAAPKDGWYVESDLSQWILIPGFSAALIVSLLLYGLLTSNAALSRAKLHADLANEHKSRFFTNMTHELRTPLTAINGCIRLINSGLLDSKSDKAKELLNTAERNCGRLIWIVNDILDLKKLESGKMEYQKSVQAISPIINEAINDIRPYANEYGINFKFKNLTAEDFTLNVDNMRLQQVVVNLLSNAIKFSPENSVVEVLTLLTPSHWRLEVSDMGNGIPEDKQETIFLEFGQADASERKAIASTGLGLSISRHIVKDHCGIIGCYNRTVKGVTSGETKGVIKGATFFVELPLSV